MPDPANNNNNPHRRPPNNVATVIPWFKLVLVGVLGGLCLLLQATIYSLESLLEEKRMLQKQKTAERLRLHPDETTESMRHRTVKNNAALHKSDLYLSNTVPISKYTTTHKTQVMKETRWKQAVSAILADWDPTVGNDELLLVPKKTDTKTSSKNQPSSSSSSSSRTVYSIGNETATVFGIRRLQEAANLGHAQAQFLLANVYVSGIWPVRWQPSLNDTLLQVQDTLIQDTPQQAQAHLLWRMAAMQGNVEAAMALAHRLDVAQTTTTTTSPTATPSPSSSPPSPFSSQKQHCWDRLAYYRAAADNILDDLETNRDSRAKILPPTEKHSLYQIHLHGGTGSKLDVHNQADESTQAIEFYQVRATAQSSPHAAYTLAHLYHHGLRGVEQNVTQALQFYEQAAKQGHWEAAGQAGDFYFWGIGMEQPDPYAAQRWYQMGLPWDLEGCRRRLERKLKTPKGSGEDVVLCEAHALNGMGLLLLFGLPMIVGVDADMAQRFFQLAKEQGNKDAAYNLAMVKLGWKTHYRSLDDLEEGGQTSAFDFGAVTDSGKWKHGLTQAEMQSVLTDLATAAGAGHVQAKHRLGMMYSEGVKVFHKSGMAHVVPRDCEKALKHLRWITDNVSPQKSKRMRRAYKQYTAGDTAGSLRNYLTAAETGSDLAQLNAAFLLEQGECLGMGRIDCAKASVRLWKAAAARGHAEASLRVGDFYYYGRFRPEGLGAGPFAWLQCILFPEKHFPWIWDRFKLWFEANILGDGDTAQKDVCQAGDGEETCPAATTLEKNEHTVQKDLEMATHYYRLAAERSASPRANYNLGFMYQYGLGVKQDFHLAKRHYDLAASISSHEAELPVTVALFSMTIHEYLVKFWISRDDWLIYNITNYIAGSSGVIPFFSSNRHSAEKMLSQQAHRKTKMDVVVRHLLSWESALVLCLTVLLSVLLRIRRTRTYRR